MPTKRSLGGEDAFKWSEKKKAKLDIKNIVDGNSKGNDDEEDEDQMGVKEEKGDEEFNPLNFLEENIEENDENVVIPTHPSLMQGLDESSTVTKDDNVNESQGKKNLAIFLMPVCVINIIIISAPRKELQVLFGESGRCHFCRLLCPDKESLKHHLETTHQPPKHALCENCENFFHICAINRHRAKCPDRYQGDRS